MLAALRDAALRDMVRRFGAVSKHAAQSEASAGGSAAAADKLHRKLTNGWHDKFASRFSLFPQRNENKDGTKELWRALPA
jgi:hypothetical protein